MVKKRATNPSGVSIFLSRPLPQILSSLIPQPRDTTSSLLGTRLLSQPCPFVSNTRYLGPSKTLKSPGPYDEPDANKLLSMDCYHMELYVPLSKTQSYFSSLYLFITIPPQSTLYIFGDDHD